MTIKDFLVAARKHYKAGKHRPYRGGFVKDDCVCPIGAALLELGLMERIDCGSPIKAAAEALNCSEREVWSFIHGVDDKNRQLYGGELYNLGWEFWHEIERAYNASV